MVGVRNGLSASLGALVTLLAVLSMAAGTGLAGGASGLACGVVLVAVAARSARTSGVEALGPADVVTLTRATLSCGVAALLADSLVRDKASGTLVVLATTALVLDAVDGRVARGTGTASAFGARLDGEADAFLMLVLSAYVARSAGAWVLAIGLARYVFAAAGWVLPWLRAELPGRYWRKVVTATSGVSLVVAAADVTPPVVATSALALSLGLLTESFGRDVWWLWRQRPREAAVVPRRARAERLPS